MPIVSFADLLDCLQLVDPIRATGRPFFWMSDEFCRDVSRGGAFVITHEPVSPGRRLLLEFELPSGKMVQAVGRVAWSRVRLATEDDDVHAGIGVEVGGRPLEVNRVVIAKGSSRQLVYYWFDQRGRQMTNEYGVKWMIFWDALTRNRTDGALVRLVTPVGLKFET